MFILAKGTFSSKRYHICNGIARRELICMLISLLMKDKVGKFLIKPSNLMLDKKRTNDLLMLHNNAQQGKDELYSMVDEQYDVILL